MAGVGKVSGIRAVVTGYTIARIRIVAIHDRKILGKKVVVEYNGERITLLEGDTLSARVDLDLDVGER